MEVMGLGGSLDTECLTRCNVRDADGTHVSARAAEEQQRRVHLSHFSRHFLGNGAECGFNDLPQDVFGMLATSMVDSALCAKGWIGVVQYGEGVEGSWQGATCRPLMQFCCNPIHLWGVHI